MKITTLIKNRLRIIMSRRGDGMTNGMTNFKLAGLNSSCIIYYMRRRAKICILKEGIIEKISNERRVNESVDDGSSSLVISNN